MRTNSNEMKIQALLTANGRSNNIVESKFSWKEEKSLYILMDIYEENLEEMIVRKKRLSPSELLKIGIQIGSAIHHMH